MNASSTILYGAVVNPLSLKEYEKLPHCLIFVGPSGEINWIEKHVPEHMLKETLATRGLVRDVEIHILKSDEFLMPGFIDTHTVCFVRSVFLSEWFLTYNDVFSMHPNFQLPEGLH
jgi:guanine deaminase